MKDEFVFGIGMAMVLSSAFTSLIILGLTKQLDVFSFILCSLIILFSFGFLAWMGIEFDFNYYMNFKARDVVDEKGFALCRFCGVEYNAEHYYDGHDCKERRNFV